MRQKCMVVHIKCEQSGVSTKKQSRDNTGYSNSIHTNRSGTVPFRKKEENM